MSGRRNRTESTVASTCGQENCVLAQLRSGQAAARSLQSLNSKQTGKKAVSSRRRDVDSKQASQ